MPIPTPSNPEPGEDLSFLDDQGSEFDTTAAATSEIPWLLDDTDRYSRLRLISWWRQERLSASRVLVVGAGALGNEVLKNLALVGVGTIFVIDKDRIEASNLSRSVLFRSEDGGRAKADVAAERTRQLNPEIRVIAIVGDVMTALGLGLFAEMDVVISCLDNREARLWVNRQCWKTTTPWVDAGIQEIQGVVKVFVPPDSACYECAMTARDYQLINLRYSCPLLRREDLLAGKVPTAPTIASIIAGLQTQEALKVLHGLPVQAGSAFVFTGVTNQFYTTKLPFRDDCLSHETYPEPISANLGQTASARALFNLARDQINGPLILALERDLVERIDCPRCSTQTEIMRPSCEVSMAEAICPRCHEVGRPELRHAVDEDGPLAERPLAELGIPPFDIVRIDGPEASLFVRLEGDRPTELATRTSRGPTHPMSDATGRERSLE